jgi:arginase
MPGTVLGARSTGVVAYGGGVTTIVVPYHQDERLADALIPLGPDVEYLVLHPYLPEGDIWRRLLALDDAAAKQIAAAVQLGGRTTVISGDCLVALATLAGVQRAGLDPALIWFDAHGDVHTLQTTTSGYLGGLSLRLALGAHADLLAEPLGLRPLREDRAVLVDGRDLDPPEAAFLAGSAVRRTTVADLDAETLPPGPLILHIDLDVIDSAELPGLLFPAAEGPSKSQVLAAISRVLATGRVTVLDIACPWHPTHDGRVQVGRADLLAALLTAAAAPA